MNVQRHLKPLALVLAASFATPAFAVTSAYWRHEEGPSGALIAAGPGTVLDSSGNGNHMQTFNPAFTSATYTNSVSPLPLRSGLPNTLALNFGPGGDDAGQNDDNYSQGAPINAQSFSALTVETAFKMNAVGGFQAILGKDGKPLGDAAGEDNSPVPPFKVLVRGDNFPDGVDNQLFIEFVDGDATLNSDVHFVNSGFTVLPDVWYHVAFTLTADTAQLWVATPSTPYTLVDTINGDFAGPAGNALVQDPTNWSVGRGMFNNGVADWSNAIIDEVRISDTALTPDQFLFVPEPASLSLLAAPALLSLRRRRA